MRINLARAALDQQLPLKLANGPVLALNYVASAFPRPLKFFTQICNAQEELCFIHF